MPPKTYCGTKKVKTDSESFVFFMGIKIFFGRKF